MLAKNITRESGFTLVELAIVLVIVGVLMGSFIGSLASRIEVTQRDNTKEQLEDIKSALLGFSAAEGRLPCPAIANPAIANEIGEEQPVGGGVCTSQHGFVPGKTLGLAGSYNRDNLLLDTWGNPIRYSVTTSDVSAFTTTGQLAVVGMPALDPDLVICNAINVAGDDCLATTNNLITNAPFILLSLGIDGSDFVNDVTQALTDQGENSGEVAVVKNVAGEDLDYTVGNDLIFINRDYSSVGSTAGQFDDLIVWVSPYILYSRMIEAGQLP